MLHVRPRIRQFKNGGCQYIDNYKLLFKCNIPKQHCNFGFFEDNPFLNLALYQCHKQYGKSFILRCENGVGIWQVNASFVQIN